WDNIKFSEKGLQETQRKFFNTIVNVYSFLAMYANIDNFSYSGTPIPVSDRDEIDRWIISRLNTTIKKVDEYFDEYEPTQAVREVESFVEQLSNWYVRRSRPRFWEEGKSLNKTAAYQTLFECLIDLSKIMSPVAPFTGEWLYKRLNETCHLDEESVHLSYYPTVEETAVDKTLEFRMKRARQISSMVLSLRNKIEINVRQPLSRIILPIKDEEEREAITSVQNVILDEINVKKIEFVNDDSGIVKKSAQPNFPKLGKRLGSKMKLLTPIVKGLSTERISEFESNGTIEIDLGDDNGTVQLAEDELEISRSGLEGWQVETENGLSVALDTELNEALIQEGLAREFVN